jgi:flagella basal body P-ring formation protein FlgA
MLKAPFIILALIMLLASLAGGQDSVHLRTNVSIDRQSVKARQVQLSLLARVSGSSALSSTLISLPASDRVTLAQVKAALEAAGIRSGQVTLHGSVCEVHLFDAKDDVAAREVTDDAPAQLPAVDLAQESTVRSAVVRALMSEHNTTIENVKVTFDARDSTFLTSDVTDLKVTVAPTGSAAVGPSRTLMIRTYRDSTLHHTQTIRVNVQILRECIVATQNISRGDPVESSISTEVRWTDSNIRCASAAEVSGALASTPIRAGKVITPKDLQPMLATKKGDLLIVETMNGDLVLRVRAIATQDARPGDEITVRTQPWNSPLRVRVNKAGNATALGPAPGIDKAPRAGKARVAPRT